jgi:hypothetical protein
MSGIAEPCRKFGQGIGQAGRALGRALGRRRARVSRRVTLMYPFPWGTNDWRQ